MKKAICIFTTALMLIGLLAGCGSAPSASGSVQGDAVSPEGQEGGTTLTVYAGTSVMKEAVDQIVADYKAQTGVTIEWEIPGDEPYTLLKTRFASGEAGSWSIRE